MPFVTVLSLSRPLSFPCLAYCKFVTVESMENPKIAQNMLESLSIYFFHGVEGDLNFFEKINKRGDV